MQTIVRRLLLIMAFATPVSGYGEEVIVRQMVLASFGTEGNARASAARFASQLGKETQVIAAEINGRTWFRVVTEALGSEAQAVALLAEVQSNTPGAWILRSIQIQPQQKQPDQLQDTSELAAPTPTPCLPAASGQ